MTPELSERLERLRQAVLGNHRGREVKVDPTGEIRIGESPGYDDPYGVYDQSAKASRMSEHKFGR